MITIYQYNTNTVRAVIDPDDKTAESRGIMRDHTLPITFTSADFIDFQAGDYCTVFGNLFVLNQDAQWTKTGNRKFAYTLPFEGEINKLSRAQYLTLNANNHFTEGKFTLRGRAIDFMGLIVTNLNRAFPGDVWTLGAVDDTNYVDIDFDGQNCLQVLSTLANQFTTEYSVESKKVSLTRRAVSSGLTLEYGKGKALSSIGKANQNSNNRITRLYPYGSDKNIGDNYRGGAPRLRLADGLFIEKNVDKYGVFEATIVFDDIYPSRTGMLSAVTTPFIFIDAAIDFDINAYLIAGSDAQITFNTGLLAGVTFNIASFDYATKTFTIDANTDDQTAQMPSADFTPAIGDQYVIINITQPLSYVNAAESALKARAIAYLNAYGPAQISFPVLCNPVWFKQNAVELTLGETFRLLATQMNIDKQIRLVAYTRNVREPYVYTATMADAVQPQPLIVKLLNAI